MKITVKNEASQSDAMDLYWLSCHAWWNLVGLQLKTFCESIDWFDTGNTLLCSFRFEHATYTGMQDIMRILFFSAFAVGDRTLCEWN